MCAILPVTLLEQGCPLMSPPCSSAPPVPKGYLLVIDALLLSNTCRVTSSQGLFHCEPFDTSARCEKASYEPSRA